MLCTIAAPGPTAAVFPSSEDEPDATSRIHGDGDEHEHGLAARAMKASLPMTIRPAMASDADAILSVHVGAIRELCSPVYDAHLIEAWVSGKRADGYLKAIAEHPFVVVIVAGAVVGFGELEPSHGEVRAVYVRPDRVRQGLGSALLRRLEGAAAERGLARLQVQASLNALPFYRSHRYELDCMGTLMLAPDVQLPCASLSKRLTSESCGDQ